MATPIRWEPAPAPATGVRSAEMVARLEQIAQQIVQAAEVRLGANGAAEARLELNLGSLGNVHVSVARGEDGTVRVAFENASAQAATALSTHAPELLERLEGRGLAVQEITVQGTDQADFRLAPATPAGGGAAADPEGGDARRQQGFDDQRQRRQRPDTELPADEDA
jgi:flagellar hook-length control protein FliK